MAEDSLAITYETLYEVLRAEKNKEELCELDENFYKNVLEYLREKTKILREAAEKNDIFSADEKDSTQIQLHNLKKIIKEIYERREKKTIEMAMNKSRTNSDIIDTANLLSQEQKFFQTLTCLLDNFRTGILAQILALKEPNLETAAISSAPEFTAEEQAEQQPPSETNEDTEQETKDETTAQQKNTKKIKMTKPIEQFVGKELEIYGPYSQEDIAQVPAEIADILIEKGSAVEIE